jgi:nanoRNase/pAp phosphatase (c-di-AMP/oligoRNAs hydrolase)
VNVRKGAVLSEDSSPRIEDLLEHASRKRRVIIQPHDFPDHDAIASAYGLWNLLRERGVTAEIAYRGQVNRRELKNFINRLEISISHAAELSLEGDEGIIVVDGCPGNKNVAELPGEEIGVIDHHSVTKPDNVPFIDIRAHYGSCSTIISEYYRSVGLEIPEPVATAFLVGLYTDTASFTRGVHQADLELLNVCYHRANIDFVSVMVRNKIQYQDLGYYHYLLEHLERKGHAAYCHFPEGCDQNLLGILSDFLLSIQEIRFALLSADNQTAVNFSARNEDPDLHAAAIVKLVIGTEGAGGGHFHMAGGVIPLKTGTYDEGAHRERFFSTIRKWKSHTAQQG